MFNPQSDVLKNFRIADVHSVTKNKIKYYVYTGLCDGINTKQMTESIWNYAIEILFIDGKIMYGDNNGKKILVYENNKKEWNEW